MHQGEALALYLLDHHTQYLLLCLLVLGQKHQSGAILTFLGHGDALQQYKLVGYLHHDAGTVAGLVAGLGAAMLHVLQHLECIVHQLMTLAAVDIHHHAHTTGIVLVG